MKFQYRFWASVLAFFIVLSTTESRAQQEVLVSFADKVEAGFDPHTYFDAKAIARRQKHGLPLSHFTDWPVTPQYVNGVEPLVDSMVVVTRWLNGVVAYATPAQVEALQKLPFVRSVEVLPQTEGHLCEVADGIMEVAESDYLEEMRANQLKTLGDTDFVAAGLNGKGVRIAILDAGFRGADTHDAFKHLRTSERIIKAWDFKRKDANPYRSSSHGTAVLSNICGFWDDNPLGLATGAEVLLARTEVVMSERIREEAYWLAAAEWADKHGADIINSSLGYTVNNYFRADMDGKTTLITRAAQMATRKGILVVNSAGNEGGTWWNVIAAPADADSVLSIGGIESNRGLHTSFSSYGPTADKRMKPNVCAYGTAAVAHAGGGYRAASGTSFSSPLIAGFAACVLQQQPELTNMQLFEQIERAGRLYPYYDYAHGFGVPRASYFTKPETEADTTFTFKEDRFGVRVVIDSAAFTRTEAVVDTLVDNALLLAEEEVEAEGEQHYVYYHIQQKSGVLMKYAVLAVGLHEVLRVRKLDYQPGTVLRVHYKGFTREYVFK